MANNYHLLSVLRGCRQPCWLTCPIISFDYFVPVCWHFPARGFRVVLSASIAQVVSNATMSVEMQHWLALEKIIMPNVWEKHNWLIVDIACVRGNYA